MTGSAPQPDADGPALSSGDALFLDFDGTLAEIGPDPDAIRLDPATAEVLAALAARLGGAVALLSGRGLADLASELRAIEREDAACRRFPRFKRSDDATALWLRVAG